MNARWLLPLAIVTLMDGRAHGQSPGRHVDEEPLWSTIEKLSEFGRPAGAWFEGGVTRLGFSEADLAGLAADERRDATDIGATALNAARG